MSVVVCARGQGLDVSSTSNELTNSRFSQDNYPVWTAYNGEQHNLTSYRRNNGTVRGLAFWYHYSHFCRVTQVMWEISFYTIMRLMA